MQTGELLDPRTERRLFPNQRDLLELLSIVDESEVMTLADCGMPLFGFQLRPTEFSLEACAQYPKEGELEEAARAEAFIALAARLDSIRTSLEQACLLFNMTRTEAAWLSRFCPQELHLLARDPAMVLVPVVNPAYYIAAATRALSPVERTVLGSVARGRSMAVMQ